MSSKNPADPANPSRSPGRVAVIIDAETFDRLVDAADDLEDRRELAAAREDDDYVPWDEVKAMLGLE